MFFKRKCRFTAFSKKVLGVDPGLTAMGLAWLTAEGIKSSVVTTELKGVDRLVALRQRVFMALACDLVVIEGYSYASGFSAHQLGELGGVLRLAFRELNVPWIVVPPSTLKVWITGYGFAPKEEVQECVEKRWGIETATSHEADAIGLMMLGQVFLECQKNRACLKEYPEKLRGIFEEGRLRCLS